MLQIVSWRGEPEWVKSETRDGSKLRKEMKTMQSYDESYQPHENRILEVRIQEFLARKTREYPDVREAAKHLKRQR